LNIQLFKYETAGKGAEEAWYNRERYDLEKIRPSLFVVLRAVSGRFLDRSIFPQLISD
jgi:hypothetical protein